MPMREAEAPLHLPAAQADPSSILDHLEMGRECGDSHSTEIGISRDRKKRLMSAEERDLNLYALTGIRT